jgi:DNA-binding NtrC family response regulator
MIMKANILIVDDDRDILETAQMFLKHEFSRIDLLEDPKKIPEYISRLDYDVILLDMNFRKGLNDGSEGFYWLERIREFNKDAVVILITAYGEVDIAVKAIKQGATDFVMKPWKNQKLLATIHASLQLGNSRKTIRRLQDRQQLMNEHANQPFEDFIGVSPAIEQVRELIRKVSVTDANVLILGENGTGKELIARSIHRHSKRRDNIFMAVDLGAITPTLFESELFGHTKGAFTDARENKTGRISASDGGTLFLDEIGNLSGPLQMKLLTAIQNQQVTPVGTSTPVQIDFRLISATNMPLYDMVRENTFRQDLLYRINTVEIRLPSLRERLSDIPLLASHFLKKYSAKYQKPDLALSDDSLYQLSNYTWPGNVRELQHALERAVILTSGHIIQPDDLFPGTPKLKTKSGTPTLEEKEKEYIEEVLQKNQGNVTKTAEVLGLTRTALYRRLNKYGIQ